jgi:hypothetical protein
MNIFHLLSVFVRVLCLTNLNSTRYNGYSQKQP